jgi:hypothetical protein
MRSPRLAVLELEMARNKALVLAGALQMSRLPEKDPGRGWKSGSGDRLSQTFLGLSFSAECRADKANMGIWSSGICGSLVRPSLAASIHADTGRLVLGKPGPGSVEARLSCFVYAALKEYLDVEGGTPAWDRLLDASFEVRGESWGLEFGLLSYSRNSDLCDGADLRLPNLGASSLEILLWRWRTDLISCSFSAQLGPLRASLKTKIDEEGLVSDYTTVKFNLPRLGEEVGWGLRCEARFGRRGASEADDSEDEDPDEDAGLSSGSGLLFFKRIGFGMDLAWSDSGGFLKRRSVSLACFAARGEERWEPAVEFVLQTGFRLGKGFQAAFKISTPSGGYSLTKLPGELPSLSLGFGKGRELP